MRAHFSPLNSTFLHCISKTKADKRETEENFNEIKDLETLSHNFRIENTF
jgi:hypothetical protein